MHFSALLNDNFKDANSESVTGSGFRLSLDTVC